MKIIYFYAIARGIRKAMVPKPRREVAEIYYLIVKMAVRRIANVSFDELPGMLANVQRNPDKLENYFESGC